MDTLHSAHLLRTSMNSTGFGLNLRMVDPPNANGARRKRFRIVFAYDLTPRGWYGQKNPVVFTDGDPRTPSWR